MSTQMSTQTNEIRLRKNLLGQTEPRTVQKELRDLIRDDYYDTIVLRPIYQRHIRWSKTAMNEFIGTIMNNGLVPGIITYSLHNEDKTGTSTCKDYEVVDGQHRLFTLKAFVSATYQDCPHIIKKFIVYWEYDPNTPVFFKDTPDVREWCTLNGKTPKFLSPEETNYFLRFSVNITNITSYVPLNQRREIFMSLQKGIPVRNSDLLKNMVDSKFIAFVTDISGEDSYENIMMFCVLKEHCTKKANKYWINWIVRFFLLYKSYVQEKQDGTYMADCAYTQTDKQIDKSIKNSHPWLNPSDEVLFGFEDAFKSFILFIKHDAIRTIKFNPTQLFALFYWSCSVEDCINKNILSHMANFAKEGSSKINRTMWESNTESEPRKQYFNECVQQIKSMSRFSALPIDDTPISYSKRMEVWEKRADDNCEICKGEITVDTFETGHIKARALGGQQDLDNLIPLCFDCNRSMGTRNAYDYKKDVYPDNLFRL